MMVAQLRKVFMGAGMGGLDHGHPVPPPGYGPGLTFFQFPPICVMYQFFLVWLIKENFLGKA